MNSAKEWGRLRLLVVLLLFLQVITVVFAWLLNPLGTKSQTEFVLLLGVDLVAFTTISYIGRLGGEGENPRSGYLLAGSAVVLVFMFLLLVA